ncbi:proteasome activator complex subunit 1 [Folsomia candida]|uniref:proteasome activator complex subunit 1 n=1 Tax=Folsomia candida TaxID=158441 RepID=UPI000B8F5E9B|nr:proteasome activator complex subunit 1 [Folsomia candida]
MKTDTQAEERFNAYRASLTSQVGILVSKTLIENKEKLDKLRIELNLQTKWENAHPEYKQIFKNNAENGLKQENGQNCDSHFENPSNSEVMEALVKITPHADEFLAVTRLLTTWMELQKGKFETGNSFGSEVIDQIVTQVDAKRFSVQSLKYFTERRKLIWKLRKHPWSEDAFVCVQLHDYDYLWTLDCALFDFARSYALIYDCLKKNWDTITSVGAAQDLQGLSMY